MRAESVRDRWIFLFRMRVREASDEQKAEHSEGATDEILGERRIKDDRQVFGLSIYLCERGLHAPGLGGLQGQQGGARGGV